MSSYYQKVEAARLFVEQGNFPDRIESHGTRWRGKPYHVIYYPSFKGYFRWMVLGERDSVDEYGYTCWGFDMKTWADGYDLLESPLATDEVTAWLEFHYGSLSDLYDYQYLSDLLVAKGVEVNWANSSRERAFQWIQTKLDQLTHTSSIPNEVGLR
ncbi:hypothetical protein [Hymenobacter chitinivorans]|uniref:hypothetical protein n=1 Tax=Hymenobacter chitinivorans TaxID=89969 RepID=UPI000C23C35B|nr:hypothetical protein [Hymenobacter chitinivorans]